MASCTTRCRGRHRLLTDKIRNPLAPSLHFECSPGLTELARPHSSSDASVPVAMNACSRMTCQRSAIIPAFQSVKSSANPQRAYHGDDYELEEPLVELLFTGHNLLAYNLRIGRGQDGLRQRAGSRNGQGGAKHEKAGGIFPRRYSPGLPRARRSGSFAAFVVWSVVFD